MDHDSDLWCCFDIPTGKLEEIYDHKYFPHEDFNSWLSKYNWKLEDTHEEGKRYLSLVSINCLKEDFGLSEEDLNRLDYVGLSFT